MPPYPNSWSCILIKWHLENKLCASEQARTDHASSVLTGYSLNRYKDILRHAVMATYIHTTPLALYTSNSRHKIFRSHTQADIVANDGCGQGNIKLKLQQHGQTCFKFHRCFREDSSTLVCSFQTTRRHIPEGSNLQVIFGIRTYVWHRIEFGVLDLYLTPLKPISIISLVTI
jgi:hypothetical protein